LEDLLLGIDIGTTGAKAALFSTDGTLAAVGAQEYRTRHPRSGWAEQDPEDWWQACCAAIRSALGSLPAGGSAVRAAAVSSQAPTMLALDSRGIPVRPALIWMDRRAEAEARMLRKRLGEEIIRRVTGNRSDPFYVAAKLLWFRTHEPELFRRTRLFVQANGYVNYRLTGVQALDNVHAALLQLRDMRAGSWSPALCQLVGVGPDLFPPIRPGYELLGEVTPEAANETGLAAGTPVVVGTVDGAAAAVEAGAVETGVAAEMTGTSTVLLMPFDRPATEPAFIAMPHALPGLHLLLAALATSGAGLRWYRQQMGGESPPEYADLTEQAAQANPGSGGVLFLPYLMGERSPIWNTNARGVFFGLSLATSRAEMVRSILEGVAFALRHNLDVVRAAGFSLGEIRSVGGGSASALWCQIKADVLGLPIIVPEANVGAPFGDAVLAGMGLGLYQDLRTSLARMVRLRSRFEPNPRNQDRYEGMYRLYRRLSDSLLDLFDEAAQATPQAG
jgi:xylulokinase